MVTKHSLQPNPTVIRQTRNAMSIRLLDKPAIRVVPGRDRDVTLHLSANGEIVQMDIANLDRGPSAKQVDDAAKSGMLWLSLSNAAERLGVHPATLRRAARSGELQARRIGREWITTLASVQAYSKQRRPAGRPPKGV